MSNAKVSSEKKIQKKRNKLTSKLSKPHLLTKHSSTGEGL